MKIIILAAVGFHFCLMTPSLFAQAVETFPIESDQGGVLMLENDYQIFPKNRLGNGLYRQQQLVLQFSDQTIHNVLEVPKSQSLVYLYQNAEDEWLLGLHDGSKNKGSYIKQVDQEFYEVWESDLRSSKLFRIHDQQIYALMPNLRTARGLTPSSEYVSFYHISKSKAQPAPVSEEPKESEESEKPETPAKEIRVYTFKVHVLKRSQTEVKTLAMEIQDTVPYLKMKWSTPSTLSYVLSDGTKKLLNIPNLLSN